MWKFSSGIYESIRAILTLCINLKEPLSVLNVLLQRGMHDTTSDRDRKHEQKIAMLSFFYRIPSSKDKISYTIVSLIIHDGNSLDCWNYVSDVFNTNTGIWWHRDDDNITKISDLSEGVILERV